MIVLETGFYGIDYGLKSPRVGATPYAGTVAASTSATGFDAAFAANANTYEYWKPTALPATWEVDFGSAETVSYFGIAAHDLATQGATVEYQTWDGSAWTTRVTHAPADNSAIFGLLTPRSISKARIRITGITMPVIGVVYFGSVVEFPQKTAYAGAEFQDMVSEDYRTNSSDTGHWLGRYVTRRGQPVSMSVNHLSEVWKSAVLDPLIADMRSRPVFIADRPGIFDKSVAFAYSTGPITPERTIARATVAYSVSFGLVGYVAA